MTRDAQDQIVAATKAAFPGLLEETQATLVPQRQAVALGIIPPGEGYLEASPEELNRQRSALVTLAREIGIVQTGKGVDMLWIKQACAALAEHALGVCDFHFATETSPAALGAVIEAAKAQLQADRRKETDAAYGDTF